ncbi:serine/threonine-protein kinase [Streptosporangium sp. NPDC000563]|uniref:serine/threonine-protein kinase n=1 Tax=Streptosporangium sp. NPDC000563 TaxID=3154366 RepID=UPI00331BCBD8
MSVQEGAGAVLAGRYRLDELIGRGGTGEVWRGYDLRPGWAVAIKILSPQVADAAVRERFAGEARTAARVVHPNVVTVLDMGEHEGRPYLVMESLTGRDLAAELAERGPLSVSETCHLVRQAALGLDAAHRAGVVHRDVKPANLHLGTGGVLKVVDFGTARVASEAAMRLTSAGSVIGTAAYLSPEQILGTPGNTASDLYALGCVCYELLCGRPPFVGPDAEVISQHVRDRPDPLRRYRPDVPPELEGLVMALLEKDPAARPTGGEVIRQVTATAHHTSAARDSVSPVSPVPAAPTAPTAPTATHDIGTPIPAQAPMQAPAPTKVTPGPPVSGPVPVPGGISALTRGRLSGRTLAIALGAVAVLVAATVWALTPSEPTGQASTAGVPSETPSPEQPTPPASPSPTPTPSPSVSRSAAAPSPDPVLSPPAGTGWQVQLPILHRAITEQELQGKIDPRTAREIRKRVTKAGEALWKGDERKARDELRKFGRDLSEARRKGRLASDGPLYDFLRKSGFAFQEEGREPGSRHRGGDSDDENDDDPENED